LKNTPIPVITFWLNKDQKILFSVGNITRAFKVNVNYSYQDYIQLVKKWLMKYYPQYEIEYEIEVSLSDEEILYKVKSEDMDLNDALLLRKKEVVKEKGMIEKIMLKEDQFIFNKDGVRSIYLSGTIKNPLSLSIFKKKLHEIKNQFEKKKFIEENSTLVKVLDEVRDVNIEYQGQQMINFFKINYDELSKGNPEKVSPVTWKFGKFVVKFSSQNLMEDCFKYLKERKERNAQM
jgi:hypothetical protein